MKKLMLCWGLVALLLAGTAMAATEETKQTAIDNGLAWLASTQQTAGAEGWWPYDNDGTLAATASAALAFIEEGYLPGDGSMYDGVVTKAVTYIFNRATVDGRFGVEFDEYQRYAEDYDNDGIYDDGNNEVIYFEPGSDNRRVYTTGVVAPVVFALGNALGPNTVVGIGSAAISGKTYAQAMQDLVDWFSWGQVEPMWGNYRGGWRYDANFTSSDNSTAQWGSLPLLYAAGWGLGVPQYVVNELTRWVNYIQNANGGSGYSAPWEIVNVSKTGGLLLELAAIGAPVGDPRVVNAVAYINNNWNTFANSTWDGNFNHPYGMWAVYKGLQIYGFMIPLDCGPENIMVGTGVANAPGGFTICFNSAPATSVAGDWYSHYCDYLCAIQIGDGSWTGYDFWWGPMATGWYINILNAVQIVPPKEVALDIKPTSCPNPLNMKSLDLDSPPDNAKGNKGGVLPVAILGTDDFDVYSIDVASLALEGIAPIRWVYEDVAAPYTGNLDCGCTTDGPDGFMDLTLKFDKADIAETLGEPYNHAMIVLTLTGFLLDGREIVGADCIRILSKVEAPIPDPGPWDNNVVLGPAVPNPFNPATRISYYLPTAGFAELTVFDVRGRLVERLVARDESAGDHIVEWNARNVASGTYFYRLRVGNFTETRKMIVVK